MIASAVANSLDPRNARRGWIGFHSRSARRGWIGFALFFPSLALMFLFLLYPLAINIYTSFFSKHLIRPRNEFVAFDNYIYLFNIEHFGLVLQNEVIWTFFSVVIQVVLGLGVAILLNQKLRGITIARAFIILPWVTPVVITVLMWKWILNELYGIVNHALLSLGIIETSIAFWSSPAMAMGTSIAINVWWGFPFMTVVFLAGLKSIDPELYEACKVDGATPWQEFIHITLPGLKHFIAVAVLVRTIWIFTFFDLIWISTKGGPSYHTMLLPHMTYLQAFQSYHLGRAAALSVILIICLVAYLIVFFKIYKYEESVS